MITRKSLVLSVAASILALGAPTAGATTPQSAGAYSAERSGGTFRLYYNSWYQGSYADFYGAIPNFAGYTFTAPGNGQGQGVKNNAASACNYSYSTARVYYNSWYGGAYDDVAPWSCRQLGVTYNDNASFSWV